MWSRTSPQRSDLVYVRVAQRTAIQTKQREDGDCGGRGSISESSHLMPAARCFATGVCGDEIILRNEPTGPPEDLGSSCPLLRLNAPSSEADAPWARRPSQLDPGHPHSDAWGWFLGLINLAKSRCRLIVGLMHRSGTRDFTGRSKTNNIEEIYFLSERRVARVGFRVVPTSGSSALPVSVTRNRRGIEA